LTWGDLDDRRNRIACALAKRLPDNAVAGCVYGKNSVEWALCNQVCQTLGLRFSPINWHLAAGEIAYIVDDCDADVVFFSTEYASTIEAMRPQIPKVKVLVCMDGPCEGAISLEALLQEASPGSRPPEHSRLGGTVGYTGGTTGKPKGALREGGKPLIPPEMRMKLLEEWGAFRMMPHPVMLVAAPMYHALPSAWFSMATPLGATFVFMPRFDALQALATIERQKVNGFYMPPILLKRILQVPEKDRARFDVSSVKMIMCGGAACPTNVKEGILKYFGPVLFELYGASELGGVAIMPPEEMLKRPLSCGKVATGYDVVLLDEQRQRIDKPGMVGEIFSKGMNIDRYHKLEEKTREAQYGDYFSVGDVGYFDEDGFLYISDRKIDMVVSGGANIYPAQVEEVLHQHPSIEDVAVFGVPDDEYGERVHAALKLVPGSQLTAKELLTWCDGRIGRFQLPREANVTFHTEDFPRSEAGKLRKKALRAEVLKTLGLGGAAGEQPRSRL